MFKQLVILFLFGISSRHLVESSNDDLLSVVVLFRHGDRAPLRPYNYDPYDESQWPFGLGQLTKLGKIQQYALGKWLRERYADYMPAGYNKSDIEVHSSNVDRCLMSAATNLAGFYTPQGDQIWNQNLLWQPVPIHTVPEEDDAVLAWGKPCPNYYTLYEELMNGEPYNSTLLEYHDRFQSLSSYSGDSIATLDDFLDLYNTLYIENLYNLTLPAWGAEVLSGEFEELCGLAWASYAYTTDLARLSSGPLIDLIVGHLEDVAYKVEDTAKFLMLSAHDSTIAPLLTSLKVFDYKWPQYTSTVIFELRSGKEDMFVNIYYKNLTDVAEITLPECDFNCDLDSFRKIVEPVRVDLQDWDAECQA